VWCSSGMPLEMLYYLRRVTALCRRNSPSAPLLRMAELGGACAPGRGRRVADAAVPMGIKSEWHAAALSRCAKLQGCSTSAWQDFRRAFGARSQRAQPPSHAELLQAPRAAFHD
jgi:hypothetical protein